MLDQLPVRIVHSNAEGIFLDFLHSSRWVKTECSISVHNRVRIEISRLVFDVMFFEIRIALNGGPLQCDILHLCRSQTQLAVRFGHDLDAAAFRPPVPILPRLITQLELERHVGSMSDERQEVSSGGDDFDALDDQVPAVEEAGWEEGDAEFPLAEAARHEAAHDAGRDAEGDAGDGVT